MICPPPVEKPVGLCYCGCGLPTTLSKQNNLKKNIQRGKPYKFLRGHNVRGTIRSPETRRKMALGKLGPKNPGYGKTRELNHNWKGGTGGKFGNQAGRRSVQDQDWRKEVFSRDDYTCHQCGAKGGKINAHHIKPWAKYPELRFVVSNGMTMCVGCHIKTHASKKVSNGKL